MVDAINGSVRCWRSCGLFFGMVLDCESSVCSCSLQCGDQIPQDASVVGFRKTIFFDRHTVAMQTVFGELQAQMQNSAEAKSFEAAAVAIATVGGNDGKIDTSSNAR